MIVELRQYTLHPGQGDVLIELFDRELVETQEAVGMRIVGQFRDEDDPDRFVWIRSFPDMEARRRALTAFYVEGEAWKLHGDAARATMVDSSDALLLRPIGPRSGFDLAGAVRPPVGARSMPSSLLVATIYASPTPFDADFTTFFDDVMTPALHDLGVHPLAAFHSEPAENTFPQLPVREGENVFIWFASFPNAAAHQSHTHHRTQSTTWTQKVLPHLPLPVQELRLTPTPSSLLH
jgi:hypothetical protein